MAEQQQPVIIIRRKKKGGAEGHHGGAWKVAYADFVTALMSFFLLMWLLNVTTAEQRKGIADYFSPASISTSEGGAGGVMGGKTITAEGAQISAGTPPSANESTVPTAGQGEEGDEDLRGKNEAVKTTQEEHAALNDAIKREEETFKTAETALKQAIENTPGLQDLASHLLIDRTPEGLRIQIIDREKFSLFPSGSALPYEKGRELLRLVGRVISKLPNQISITGHTDSAPFSAGSRRDNWGLSTDRANVSRSELVTAGVNELRVARIVGMSDRDPLVKEDPKDPKNRRISIVLLRQTLPPTSEEAPAPPQPSP
ncbi:MAG: OmpA family protein [Alphaproteobacteria bacterium]|nr:OmpA family protein [Alphaproteobacteria bacterium]